MSSFITRAGSHIIGLLGVLAVAALAAACGGGSGQRSGAATQAAASDSGPSASSLYAALRDTPFGEEELPQGFSPPVKVLAATEAAPTAPNVTLIVSSGPDGNDEIGYSVYADERAAKAFFDEQRDYYSKATPGQQFEQTRFIEFVAPDGFEQPAFCETSDFNSAARTYCSVLVGNVVVQGFNANTIYVDGQVGHAEALARAAVKHLAAVRDQ